MAAEHPFGAFVGSRFKRNGCVRQKSYSGRIAPTYLIPSYIIISL